MPMANVPCSQGFVSVVMFPGPLAQVLPGLLAHYPEVGVLLTINNRVVDLLAEDYDLATRIGPIPSRCSAADDVRFMAVRKPRNLNGHLPIGKAGRSHRCKTCCCC
jgi:DNA-binding transcriptional LysR family regulator